MHTVTNSDYDIIGGLAFFVVWSRTNEKCKEQNGA